MKCVFALLFFCAAIYASAFDAQSDQQILQCIHSPEFSNKLLQYSYEGKYYPIGIMHNPEGRQIWGDGFDQPVSWSYAMVGDIPLDLIWHLEKLLPELDEGKVYISLRGFANFSLRDLLSLKPCYIAQNIGDPTVDQIVREAFSSTGFVNQVVYYYLMGKYYKVRVLHNPEGRTFSAAKVFKIHQWDSANSYSISWNYKYGLITNFEAPQELLDHLSLLANSSCWDWYMNFTVHNGSYVEHNEYQYYGNTTVTTTYYLDTWFNYTETFH